MFDTEQMRTRFADLSKQRAAIIAKVAPVAEQRRKARAAHEAAEAKINDKLTELRADLPAIDQEMAMISRALKGKTGVAEEA